ncbi:MAG: hypothetical protein M3214_12805 [Actinomycetota bacterium]|nr:hypothetical protein [Actinomycetota bacterium]
MLHLWRRLSVVTGGRDVEGRVTAQEPGELLPEILATVVPVGSLGKSGRLGRLGENADDVRDLGRLSGRADELAQLSARYGNDIVEVRTPERADLRALTNPSFMDAFTDGVYETVTSRQGLSSAGSRTPAPLEFGRHPAPDRTGSARVSNEELARVPSELEELLESCGETGRVDWVREQRRARRRACRNGVDSRRVPRAIARKRPLPTGGARQAKRAR